MKPLSEKENLGLISTKALTAQAVGRMNREGQVTPVYDIMDELSGLDQAGTMPKLAEMYDELKPKMMTVKKNRSIGLTCFGTSPSLKPWQGWQFPNWMYKNNQALKIGRRKHLKLEKKQSRYSTIGNLLARERSLKKFGKKHLKRLVKKDPNALVAVAVSEPNREPSSFLTFSQRVHFPSFGSGSGIFGFAASDVIVNGTKEIEGKISLDKSVCLPKNSSDIITKSKISPDSSYLKNLNNDDTTR